MKIVALFAGIGGLELGLERAGHEIKAVAEIDPHACEVLARRFPNTKNLGDVATIESLPRCDLLTAGFPCQDLSQAGGTAGIHGNKSRLVRDALKLIGASHRPPRWLLFENVPFMLSLHQGAGMAWLTSKLEKLGYQWAYRVIDSRAFGLAQRRRRLFILASRQDDPSGVLFAEPGASREPIESNATPCGFYWTEGNRGLGWAVDAIPPLKCNSGVNIAAPPAVWIPASRSIVTPTLEDAEALQGFPRGWTQPAAVLPKGSRVRWRLIGNAVSVPVAEWIGRRLLAKRTAADVEKVKLSNGHKWPKAAYGSSGTRYHVQVSEWPGRRSVRSISDFLSHDAPMLSVRATRGFLSRLQQSTLHAPEQFIRDLSRHIRKNEAGHRPINKQEDVPHTIPRQFA